MYIIRHQLFLSKKKYFLQYKERDKECKSLKEAKEELIYELTSVKSRCNDSEEKILQIEADLLNALAEVNVSIFKKHDNYFWNYTYYVINYTKVFLNVEY